MLDGVGKYWEEFVTDTILIGSDLETRLTKELFKTSSWGKGHVCHRRDRQHGMSYFCVVS